MKAFTVYDTKAEAYLDPFFARNEAVALRMVEAAARKEGHEFNVYAHDYQVYRCGSWDGATGTLKGEPVVHLCNVVELLARE